MFPHIKNKLNSNKSSFLSLSSNSSSNNLFISNENNHEKLNKKKFINNSSSLDIFENNNINTYKLNSFFLNIYIYNSPPSKEIKKFLLLLY